MDPNANLAEQRRLSRDIIAQLDLSERAPIDLEGQAMRLAELVQALDEWISRGGFLPSAWAHNNNQVYQGILNRQESK